jgi:hypothetical protein
MIYFKISIIIFLIQLNKKPPDCAMQRVAGRSKSPLTSRGLRVASLVGLRQERNFLFSAQGDMPLATTLVFLRRFWLREYPNCFGLSRACPQTRRLPAA